MNKRIKEIIIISMILIVLISSYFYLKPAITGLITVEKQFNYSDKVNLEFEESGTYIWNLANPGNLKSIKIDGSKGKGGNAKVYIENNGVRYLIFDSSKLVEKPSGIFGITGFVVKEDKDEIKTEIEGALNTEQQEILDLLVIDINKTRNDVEIEIEAKEKKDNESRVKNKVKGDITIEQQVLVDELSISLENSTEKIKIKIKAEFKEQANNPPFWNSEVDNFELNDTLAVNLSIYFYDADGDLLTYSASNTTNVSFSIDDEIITLIPASNIFDTKEITLAAFDGQEITFKEVLLIIDTLEEILINETPVVNETIEKAVNIILRYGDGAVYDANDDGVESLTGVVDFTTGNSGFNWNYSSDNLCTRYEIYSVENEESTFLCYGNSQCCAFVSLQNSRELWNESLLLAYGSYGSSNDNIVFAQVLSVDYNLSSDNPYSEIVYSPWANLTAKFVKDIVEFDNVCVDTCLVSGFNDTSYKLIVEIENTTLKIDKIEYAVEQRLTNEGPVLIKNIENISLVENKNYTLDLSSYFNDADNDKLNYSYYAVDNISIRFENDLAYIIPQFGFTGNRFTFISANDSYGSVVSNVFKISVNESGKPRIQLGRAVKWVETITINKTNETIKLVIPKTASNITIKTIINNTIKTLSKEKIKIIDKGKNKSMDEFEKGKELEKVKRKVNILEEAKREDADKVIIENEEIEKQEIDAKLIELEAKESQLIQELTSILGLITGAVVSEVSEVGANETVILIEEPVEEIIIEYITEPPFALEKYLGNNRKQIKIISETSYENVLAYTDITESSRENIKLYWIRESGRELFEAVEHVDTNLNGLIDRIEWIIPHLSNQTFEVSITILNVQSYPTVGGNWTVRFNTSGTGNLTILASNGTSYSETYDDNAATADDLTPLALNCGSFEYYNRDDLVNHFNFQFVLENNSKVALIDTIRESLDIKGAYVESYSCNSTSFWTVKVLTPGVHTQQFNFSDQIDYAKNFADVNISGTGSPIVDHNWTEYWNSSDLNGTDAYNYGGKELPGSMAVETNPPGGANMTGNVLLMHFNNDSSFGENDTLVYDFSGNGNNGTVTSATWTSSGKLNGGFEFDGDDDYVAKSSATGLPQSNEAFTVELWAYSTNPDHQDSGTVSIGDMVLWGQASQDDWNNFLFFKGNLHHAFNSNDLQGGTLTTINTWYHIAVTYDGTTRKLYLDGIEDASAVPVRTPTVTGSNLLIGTRVGGGFNFQGKLDELAIWNRSLSADEIHDIYKRSLPNHIGLARNGTVYNSSGNFVSAVFDAGSIAAWKNISWVTEVNYSAELPNDRAVESSTYFVRGANMTGNVLLMHFNNDSSVGENDTHVYDFSGSGNNGTVTSATWTSSGKLGAGAFEFDGGDDYIDISDALRLANTTSGTISAWINGDDFTSSGVIVGADEFDNGANQELIFYVQSSQKLRAQIVSISAGGIRWALIIDNTMDEDRWYHVALVHNGTEPVLYLDGIKVAQTFQTSTDKTVWFRGLVNLTTLSIGANYIGAGVDLPFDGTIDEVAIWNRSLSATEILDIYKRGALRLNLTVRSCDDNACSGESFTDIDDASLQTLSDYSIASNQYFQYKAGFETDNAIYTPELYNVTIDYADHPPTVTLVSPANNTNFTTNNITFECNATDDIGLVNITLYGSWSGSWTANETKALIGTSDSTTFAKTIKEAGTHSWNCLAYDSTGQSDWGDSNRTFTLRDYNFTYLFDGATTTSYGYLNGTSNNTFYNESILAMQLEAGNTNGSFTSQVFDGGDVSAWKNISWVSNVIGELPANQLNEITSNKFATGNINMTGNILLFHLNNDSVYGESDTKVYDFSGSGNNGTVEGSAVWNSSNGKLNGGFDLEDDTNDKIRLTSIGSSVGGTNDVSYSIWINSENIGSKYFLALGEQTGGDVRGLNVGYQANKVCYREGSGGLQGCLSQTISTGTWYHIVMVYNGTYAKVYQDGVLGLTFADTNTIEANPDLLIGWSNDCCNFDGKVDEVAIWNRTLSAQEVLDIYKRGVLRLNLTVRSCDDAACSGDSWNETYTSSPQDLSVANNQYFQYKAEFETDNVSYTPELYNVTIDYTLKHPPNVTLVSPANNTIFTTNNITFECNATDDIGLVNITLYGSWSGSWTANETKNLTGTGNSTTFAKTIKEAGTHSWNCLAYDSTGQSDWGDSNRTFTLRDYNFTYLFDGATTTSYGYLNGTLNNTFYNESTLAMQLEAGNTNGSFTSQVFDGGDVSVWNNISWVSYIGELPNNQEVSYKSNMTGNVLLMHFNNDSSYGENDTHVYDFSGSGNNGTVNGSAVFNASGGKLNGAFDFDGVNDFINIPNSASMDFDIMTDPFSHSVWIKSSDSSLLQVIWKQNGASFIQGLYGQAAEKMSFFLQNSGSNRIKVTGSLQITSDVWHNLVWTYDGSSSASGVNMYVDGVSDTSITVNSDSLTSYTSAGQNFTIGSDASSNDPFVGNLDEFSTWNRSLSSEEILDIYKRGVLRLNLTVRSCDDNACSGESFTDIKDTSPQTLSDYSIASNQYFQYKALFETDNASYTPELYNVTIDYRAAPTVTLNAPANNSYIDVNYVLLNATVFDVDADNMTVYFIGNGTTINTTNSSISNGSTVTYNWTSLSEALHNWTVIAYDNTTTLNSTPNYFYFTIDLTVPVINGTLNSTQPKNHDIINASFNATDGAQLDTGQVIVNDTGFKRYFNFSLSGTEAQFSQNFTIFCSNGCVINVTGRANDTAGNIKQNETLIIISVPTIQNNYTIPLYPRYNENVTFYANVSDSVNNIASVNFTIINPEGTKVQDSVNGSRNGQNWNITHNLTSYGTWLWNISVYDNDGFIINSSTGTIILMELTLNLNTTRTALSAPVAVSGHINLSNGTNVTNTNIIVYINELNVTNATTDSFGNYNVTIAANSTKGLYTIKVNTTYADIPGENTIILDVTRILSISMDLSLTELNTTNSLTVKGKAKADNGTMLENVSNTKISIYLDGTLLTADHTITNFTSGNHTQAVFNGTYLILNTTPGTAINYSDDYSTNKYTNDAFNYDNEGYTSGILFSVNVMSVGKGNVTYYYTSLTKFESANVSITTGTTEISEGGNATIFYSYDNTTWTALNWTNESNTRITASVPVTNNKSFYVLIQSEKTATGQTNPVTLYDINYTEHDYVNGTYVSDAINFTEFAVYDKIYWNEILDNGTNITLKTQTSADNITWGSLSSTYLNSPANISSNDNTYIRFLANLTTTNASLTPKLSSVTITYSNLSTNAFGNYTHTFTIPTDVLGVRVVKVNITSNDNLDAQNQSNITVWAQTNITFSDIIDYSGTETNFTINASWTRIDINQLILGTINITLTNKTNPQYSRLCNGSSCNKSFLIPSDIVFGNYTINITATNESVFYRNASINFTRQLEYKTTTARIFVTENKTIGDFSSGTDYKFQHNVSLQNLGNASMINATGSVVGPPTSSVFKSGNGNIVNATSCGNILPSTLCNQTFNITIDGSASAADHNIVWRANWTNNDGSKAQSASYIMKVTILEVPVLNVTLKKINKTINHGSTLSSSFTIQSTGSSALNDVAANFTNDTMPSGWFSFTGSKSFSSIAAGQSETVTYSIAVPEHYTPGTYNGTINVSASNHDDKFILVNITVPTNGTWILNGDLNITTNFTINQNGTVGNFTINNTGNIDMNFTLSYAAGGTTSFNDFVPPLVQENKEVNGEINNPTSLFVAKNSSSNFSVFQRGHTDSVSDIGVNISIQNLSGNPTNRSAFVTFYINDNPPAVGDIIFLVNGVIQNHTEFNRTIFFKAAVTDDFGIDPDAGDSYFNVTWPGGNFDVRNTTFSEFIFINAKYIAINFSGNFTPDTVEVYNVTITFKDTSGQEVTSSIFNFTSIGTTTVDVISNASITQVIDITQTAETNVSLNISINNSGLVTANYNNLTTAIPAGWSIYPESKDFENLSANNTLKYEVFNLTVPKATSPGVYIVTATINWTNPVGSTNTSALTISINVTSNQILNLTARNASLTINHSRQSSLIFGINSTGNDNLTNVNVSCVSGAACNFTISFNNTLFNVSAGTTVYVNASITVPDFQDPSNYTAIINASIVNLTYKTLNLTVTVPEDEIFNLSPDYLSKEVSALTTGTIGTFNITNLGNIQLGFIVNSTDTSVITINTSNVTISKNSSVEVSLSYTSPETPGDYIINITVTNTSLAIPQRNVTVNLTVLEFSVNITSPNNQTPLTNVTSNKIIIINAGALFGIAPLTENVTWYSVLFNTTSCPINNYTNSGNTWTINCTAPDIADGLYYDLKVSGNYTSVSATFTDTEPNAILYRDITAPTITNKSKQDAEPENDVNLTLVVSDNVNTSTVIAEIEYPNSTINSTFKINYTATNISGTVLNGTYLVNLTNLTLVGDYDVVYYVNDTTGNSRTDTDSFEVFLSKPRFSGTISDRNGAGVATAWTFHRPNTATILTNFTTNSTGIYNVTDIHNRTYDLKIEAFSYEINLLGINFTKAENDPLDLDDINADDVSIAIALYKPLKGIGVSTSLNASSVNVTINYTGTDFSSETGIKLFRCSNWSFTSRTCSVTWTELTSTVDVSKNTVTGTSSSFSAYMAAESKCGNGLCEATYGETTSTCSQDCVTAQGSTSVTVIGGGGGGGGISKSTLQEELEKLNKTLQEALKAAKKLAGVEIATTSIYKELFPGEDASTRLRMKNTKDNDVTIIVKVEGTVKKFVFFEDQTLVVSAGQERDVVVKITVPQFTVPGSYEGDIILTSDSEKVKIPITIRVLQVEGKLLDVKIQPLVDVIAPGETLNLRMDLINLGKTKRVDVQFNIMLIDPKTNKVLVETEEAFAVETSYTAIKQLKIPEDTPRGKYLIQGTAHYSSLEEQDQQAVSIATIKIQRPFLKIQFLGITIGQYIIIILIITANWGAYLYYKHRQAKKRRYIKIVDLKTLPKPGKNSGFIGKIAETGIRTFIDLNRLQTHTLVAGATGSGKTVAAQDIIEEALLKDIGVILFDPTAQWTGFLRKCQQKQMLKRYRYFEMKEKNAKAFKGNIHTITNPRELIDIKKYIVPGEINIFNLSKLDPKDIDTVVASTIQQVFRANLPESPQLKTLIVYDEVHRLLKKFGGTGKGFIQIERGAREFRKWGLGLVLISQVLSDFVGEIKANIGTEIQMRTRYEGDLERVSMKYGEDIQKSVIKATVGTGMVVNAEYNHGRPYFVSFRPILHSVSRLSDKELETYEKYSNRIDDLAYQLEQLKSNGKDIFDLELELKLAKSKIGSSQFDMVDIYLSSLEPRISSSWKKIGKQPKKREIKLISEEVIEAAVKTGEIERKKFVREQEKLEGKEGVRLKKAAEEALQEAENAKINLEKIKKTGKKEEIKKAEEKLKKVKEKTKEALDKAEASLKIKTKKS